MKFCIHTSLAIVIILMAGGCASTPKTGEWTSLFNGHDLKGWKSHIESEWDLYRDAGVKDGSIEFPMGTPYSAISLSNKFPQDNYELELSAMRTSGNDILCGILMPVGNSHVSMILGGWGNHVVGLSCIDNMVASDNESSCTMSFEDNRWYRVRVAVTPGNIRAWIDDSQVIDQERENRTISPYPGLEDLIPFGLFTWQTASLMKDIRYRSTQ